MSDATTTAKVRKLLDTLTELREKETAVLEEIGELLGGGVGMGAKMKAGYAAFAAAWESRYTGGRYAWIYKRDAPGMKRLIQLIGLVEVGDRAARYIRNDDPWLMRNGHPFGVFVSQINQYAEAQAIDAFDLEAPSDCRHRPPCKSDQQHTQRNMADNRAGAR